MAIQIKAVVQIPIDSIQTNNGIKNQSKKDRCYLCGKKLGNNQKLIHLLDNGNIVSSDEDFDNSQGFFSIGSECAKKLVLSFAF